MPACSAVRSAACFFAGCCPNITKQTEDIIRLGMGVVVILGALVVCCSPAGPQLRVVVRGTAVTCIR